MESYTAPIYDGDTHLYEAADSWNKYLPQKYAKDWSFSWKTGTDGEYALYLGERKAEVSGGYYTEDGRVPPPGRLKEWMKAMQQGKENVDMRVPTTPDMLEREARLRKMDEFGVEACTMFPGNIFTAIGLFDEVEPSNALIHAYNQWLSEDWGFAHQERLSTEQIRKIMYDNGRRMTPAKAHV